MSERSGQEKVLRQRDVRADDHYVTSASIDGDPRNRTVPGLDPASSNPWPTVPGRLPLTDAAVQTIAGIDDPAVRNLWITQSYADLAHRLVGVLRTDQTWCSFAIWASNTAGLSIRGDELPKLVDDLLLGADEDCSLIVREVNHCAAGLRQMGMVGEFAQSHLATLVTRAVEQVAGFIANGNNLVYRELAPLFVRLLEHVDRVDASFAGLSDLATVDSLLDTLGVPPIATSPDVRIAFQQYVLAMATSDPVVRAQHVLAANIAAVLHEQRRLQPDIEAALDAGLIDFGDDLAGIVRGHIAEALLHPFVRHLHVHLSEPLERVWQHVATRLLMTMHVPGQVLHLHADVPPIPTPIPKTVAEHHVDSDLNAIGVGSRSATCTFPVALAAVTLPAAASLLGDWDPTHGTGVGSGAQDWADLHQRMGYIVNLFRSRQQWMALTAQPFDAVSLAWMEQDRLPRRLAAAEPTVLRDVPPSSDTPSGVMERIPHIVVSEREIVHVSSQVSDELGCDASALLGTLDDIGLALGDSGFTDLIDSGATMRVRLNSSLQDRPVQLRVLASDGGSQWIELRSLAAEFRMESLLRRSGIGHMLISPAIELQWSLSADGMLPGDNPLNWVELMDPDDMQTLGKAIHDVGQNPNVQRHVRHRLNADRTYTMIDRVESAMHDPDLRAVLVRSRLEGAPSPVASSAGPSQFAGFTISDHMTIGVVVASNAGKILHRNAAAATLLKARTGQSVLPTDDGFSLTRRLNDDDAEALAKVFVAATEGRPGSLTIPSPRLTDRWLRISVSPAAASTVVMTIEDTTELAEAERAVRASNSLLAALDAHSEELVIVFAPDGRTRYMSSSVRRHLGHDAVIDHPDDFLRFVHPADRSAAADLQRRVLSDPHQPARVDLRITVEDPAGRWHHATLTNLLADADVTGLVLTLRDVHERHLLEHELRFRATHDELTTLPDRTGLRSRLDEVVDQARERGERTAVVFCDIDNFKTINDQFGHHVGDFVLTELASRLRAGLRVTDFVGRFGGDEFVIVFPDVADEDHALALAAGVFRECTGPAVLGPHHVEISVSMGLAVSQSGEALVEELLQQADQAMYWSKQGGRGRLSRFAESVEHMVVVQ